MKRDGAPPHNYFVLSTGKRLRAYAHVIGLRAYADGSYELCGGYDDGEWSMADPDLTTAEKAEIADYMIEQWQAYKAWAMRSAAASDNDLGTTNTD